MDYKEKYLKYKRKYLELKGGAKCPFIGFYQHRGECWHDSFTMILLYSDGLSEHIQQIFNTTEDYKFDYEDCITYAINNNKFMLPINIEEKDYEVFFKNSINYIRQLYSRYMNDKLPILPKQRPPLPNIKQIEPSFKRFRRNSINESLACVNYIYKITNINMSDFKRINYTHIDHGGHMLHDFTILQLFNYFLLNYFPPKLHLVKNMKFINNHIIQFLDIGDFLNEYYIRLPDFSDMLFKINEIDRLLDICKGIRIAIRFKEVFDEVFKIKKIESSKLVGHALSFIKCGDVEYFYDDNGVENGKKVVEKEHQLIKSTIDDPELSIEELTFRKERNLVLKQFNWKIYFKNKIKLIRPILEEMEKSYKELEKIWLTIEDLPYDSPEKEKLRLSANEIQLKMKEIILSMSECFSDNKPEENMPIGKSYLNMFFINTFEIITIDDLVNEDTYMKSIANIYKNNKNINIYQNEKIDKLRKYIYTRNEDDIIVLEN
jgi:hypothetical protein